MTVIQKVEQSKHFQFMEARGVRGYPKCTTYFIGFKNDYEYYMNIQIREKLEQKYGIKFGDDLDENYLKENPNILDNLDKDFINYGGIIGEDKDFTEYE